MNQQTEVFWVVGNASDVGKTTFSVALIETLNELGIATVGFKPYALSLFAQNIDLLAENCPANRGTLFGGDALLLTKASPLTAGLEPDLVAPSNAFCFPAWDHKFLLRTGSVLLNNIEFFTHREMEKSVLRRPDITELSKRIYLPLDRLKYFSVKDMAKSFSYHDHKKQSAFDHLTSLGPQSMVLEGGGSIIPTWQNGPKANHIFLLTDGKVHFFADIDRTSENEPFEETKSVIKYMKWAKRHCRKSIWTILPIAIKKERSNVLQTLIKRIFEKAELH